MRMALLDRRPRPSHPSYLRARVWFRHGHRGRLIRPAGAVRVRARRREVSSGLRPSAQRRGPCAGSTQCTRHSAHQTQTPHLLENGRVEALGFHLILDGLLGHLHAQHFEKTNVFGMLFVGNHIGGGRCLLGRCFCLCSGSRCIRGSGSYGKAVPATVPVLSFLEANTHPAPQPHRHSAQRQWGRKQSPWRRAVVAPSALGLACSRRKLRR